MKRRTVWTVPTIAIALVLGAQSASANPVSVPGSVCRLTSSAGEALYWNSAEVRNSDTGNSATYSCPIAWDDTSGGTGNGVFYVVDNHSANNDLFCQLFTADDDRSSFDWSGKSYTASGASGQQEIITSSSTIYANGVVAGFCKLPEKQGSLASGIMNVAGVQY